MNYMSVSGVVIIAITLLTLLFNDTFQSYPSLTQIFIGFITLNVDINFYNSYKSSNDM